MTSFQPITGPRDFARTPSPREQGTSSSSYMMQGSQDDSPMPGCSITSYSPVSHSDSNTFATHPSSGSLSAFQDGATQLEANQRVVVVGPGKGLSSVPMLSDMDVVKSSSNRSSKSKKGKDGGGGAGPDRRQKRLQRNRESARLSRRRRKQYLEVLEDRVMELGTKVDQERRQHMGVAVMNIHQRRLEVLLGNAASWAHLEKKLSRTSNELMVVTTFQWQQLRSFSLSPSTKFVLWLTLQTDTYFRGGRAASERLSAARIGERMLRGGTNQSVPNQSMWPLLCNEVCLSHDQEEKVRAFQRTLLTTPASWVDRHTAFASNKVMQSTHDVVQGLTLRLGQRERSTHSLLSEEQRLKFLAWSTRNRERVSRAAAACSSPPQEGPFHTSVQYHTAANLYILNDRLQRLLEKVPRAAPIVTGAALKRLSRRPTFESLGGSVTDREEGRLSRENSFASSGSLKRSASEMSIDCSEDRPALAPLTPVDAEAAAGPAVEQALGFLKDIVPPAPKAIPVPVATTSYEPAPQPSMDPAPAGMPATAALQQMHLGAVAREPVPIAPHPSEPETKHIRTSSFLPAHLNVVPEEMWPADEADDLLMNFVDGEWAIGEEFEMPIT